MYHCSVGLYTYGCVVTTTMPSALTISCLPPYFYSLGHALGQWFTDVLNSITSPCRAEVLFAALSHNVPDDDAATLRLIMKEVRRTIHFHVLKNSFSFQNFKIVCQTSKNKNRIHTTLNYISGWCSELLDSWVDSQPKVGYITVEKAPNPLY